jgi:pyocin large subunit-like protein
MWTALFWILLLGLVLSGARVTNPAAAIESIPKTEKAAPPARETWANPSTLHDHFERHGSDFKAKDPVDYAAQAWRFLQRARTEGLPAKIDAQGTIRVFDPKTGAFAAYNREGKTKTYFKPQSPHYFERQPGHSVDLKTHKF